MSTRSRIAIQLDTGRYLSVYCHFDGYPKCLGVNLQEDFPTREDALKLINGGDISYIQDGDAFYYAKRSQWDTVWGASKDEPWEDVQPHTSNTMQELIHVTDDCNGAYLYVYYNGATGWTCYDMDSNEQIIESEAA